MRITYNRIGNKFSHRIDEERWSMPRMVEENQVVELTTRANEYLHDTSLSPKEYEALKRSVAELSPVFSVARAYFVLGSYGRPEIRRLQLVKDRLNRRTNTYAFLMVDIRKE